MLTQEEMNTLVPEKLREIERTYHVEVLWAIESGSRALGFPLLSPSESAPLRRPAHRLSWGGGNPCQCLTATVIAGAAAT